MIFNIALIDSEKKFFYAQEIKKKSSSDCFMSSLEPKSSITK